MGGCWSDQVQPSSAPPAHYRPPARVVPSNYGGDGYSGGGRTGYGGPVVSSGSYAPSSSSSASSPSFTFVEVVKQRLVVVEGLVYDLTAFAATHPGGPSVIRSLAGKDGTDPFLATHGRNSSAAAALRRHLVGTLRDG
jgi:hypothetical protein